MTFAKAGVCGLIVVYSIEPCSEELKLLLLSKNIWASAVSPTTVFKYMSFYILTGGLTMVSDLLDLPIVFRYGSMLLLFISLTLVGLPSKQFIWLK